MEFIILTIGLYLLSLAGGVVYVVMKFNDIKAENEKEVKQKPLIKQ